MALRYNGILTLGDQVPSFRTVWDTRNLSSGSSADNQIELPLKGSGFNFNVNWGDGNIDYGIQNAGDARKLHTYATPGIYTVTITGNIVNWGFNGGGDCEKLLRVLEFGPLVFPSNAIQVFWGCKYLDITATDFPDVSNVIDFSSWFRDCENLIWNSNVQSLDTSSGKNFMAMFRGCKIFDQDISGLDMSNAEDISHMMNGCWIFKQNIGLWNITNKVTAAHYVLNECREFDYSLNNWDMSNCVTLHYALRQTKLETGISDWRPASATRIDHILEENLVFNDDLGGWVLSAVQNAERALSGCIVFDEPLFNAPNSTLTNMRYMLNLCGNFTDKENRLESLNTSNVELFDRALFGTTKLNPDLSSWNVESGQDFTNFMGLVTNGYSMSMENYDKLLASWSAQDVNSGITITFSGINYKNSIDERAILVGKGWTINDGGFKDIDESLLLHFDFVEGFEDFVRGKSYYGNQGYFWVGTSSSFGDPVENTRYGDGPKEGMTALELSYRDTVPGGGGEEFRSGLKIPSSDSTKSLSEEFTVAYWARGLTNKYLMTNTLGSEGPGGVYIRNRATLRPAIYINYETEEGDPVFDVPTANNLKYDEFTHYAWTYDGDTVKCFADGVEINSVILEGKSIQNNEDWCINSENRVVSHPAQISQFGAFSDYRVYNRALSQNEIENLI